MASEEEKRHPLGPIKRAGSADPEFSVSRGVLRRMAERFRRGWEKDHPMPKFRDLGPYRSSEVLRHAEERFRSAFFSDIFSKFSPDHLVTTTEEEEALSLEESEELEVLLTQTLHTLRGCHEVACRISASLDRISNQAETVSVAYREFLTP